MKTHNRLNGYVNKIGGLNVWKSRVHKFGEGFKCAGIA